MADLTTINSATGNPDVETKKELIVLLTSIVPEPMPVEKIAIMADLLMTAQSLNEIEDIVLALHSEIPTITIVARVSKIINITHREEPRNRQSSANLSPVFRCVPSGESVSYFLLKALLYRLTFLFKNAFGHRRRSPLNYLFEVKIYTGIYYNKWQVRTLLRRIK